MKLIVIIATMYFIIFTLLISCGADPLANKEIYRCAEKCEDSDVQIFQQQRDVNKKYSRATCVCF